MWCFQVPGRPIFCVQRDSNTNQKISIDLSQCGRWLVSGGTDGKAQIWNVAENAAPSVHMQVRSHMNIFNYSNPNNALVFTSDAFFQSR